MKNIFFTSDMHLGHKNILEYSKRPFSTVDEMDEEIIRRFNSVVGKNDVIYNLGDFCFKNPKFYNNRFNGTMIRLKGDHDHDIKEPLMLLLKVPGLVDNFGEPLPITLCHYPMRSWRKAHWGAWHLHGHMHDLFKPYGLSFDVGVDSWDYYPLSFEQVSLKMIGLEQIPVGFQEYLVNKDYLGTSNKDRLLR